MSGIRLRPTAIFIPDKEPKYRTVKLNTGHLTPRSIRFEDGDDVGPGLKTAGEISQIEVYITRLRVSC